MRILIEEYKYKAQDVRDVLQGIEFLEDIEGYVSISYVGYFYNPHINDCVFILPKVLMDESNQVFKHLDPTKIIHLDKAEGLTKEEESFIYEFSVWVYRAIDVFNRNNENDIVFHKKVELMGGRKRFVSNTFLDILMALISFNKENQDYITFTLKNLHSGYNKINWTRTISHSTAIVTSGTPLYTDIVNKKRQVNFDEELLVIYYSILHYINDKYGFKANINVGFELITGNRFQHYMNGFGAQRLKQIKYKYFSDKALKIWEMCLAFFDKVSKINVSTKQQEYLLVKSFYIVFEAMIDELIGDNPMPDGMDKKQEDGKIVDHLYTAKSLIEGQKSPTYYIGDSKYYKIGHELTDESVYKQYTYARNVIQWNLNLFNDDSKPNPKVKLRDEVTEGYNIIPNFFISAKMDYGFDYSSDGIQQTDRKNKRWRQTHFKNRLFDRDTLLLFHYDVNFLFILSLYARDNSSQKASWKESMRKKFRSEIQDWLKDDYDFYAMKAKPGVIAKDYFEEHFRDILGKTFAPFEDQEIYSLALDNSDKKENEQLLTELRKYFYVEECKLGEDVENIINEAEAKESSLVVLPKKTGVLIVMIKNYQDEFVKFMDNGRYAVGFYPEKKDSMNIVKHLGSIGFILFNVDNSEYHLFSVKDECDVRENSELYYDIARNADFMPYYVTLEIDASKELESSNIFPMPMEAVTLPMYMDIHSLVKIKNNDARRIDNNNA
jgi:hypothetical protein